MSKIDIAMKLAKEISKLVPDSAGQLPSDLTEHIKAILQVSLQKMDLVTREEFDLLKQRVAHLEEQLAKLETGIADVGTTYKDTVG